MGIHEIMREGNAREFYEEYHSHQKRWEDCEIQQEWLNACEKFWQHGLADAENDIETAVKHAYQVRRQAAHRISWGVRFDENGEGRQ